MDEPPAVPEVTPETVAAAMYERDRAAQLLGIEIVDVGAERAAVRLTVADEHCNGFGILHGGITFALADTAMAYASNAANVTAVAASAAIDLLAPAVAGETLDAVAAQRWTNGRTAVWDVTVSSDGRPIGLFRGTTRRIGPAIVDAQ